MVRLSDPYYSDDYVTLYHGDCRDLLPSIDADVVVTDPPYGVNARANQHGKSGGKVVLWDAEYPHAVINELARERPVIAFGAASTIGRELEAFDTLPRVAVWSPKFRLGMIAKDGFAYRWHPLYLFGVVNEGPTVRDVFDHQTEAGHWFNHPASKPVALMVALVAVTTGTILDPFTGSGSTLVAAKSLNRKAIGIEIEERYCEVAASRLSQEVLGLTA